jgi:hypothetical protein
LIHCANTMLDTVSSRGVFDAQLSDSWLCWDIGKLCLIPPTKKSKILLHNGKNSVRHWNIIYIKYQWKITYNYIPTTLKIWQDLSSILLMKLTQCEKTTKLLPQHDCFFFCTNVNEKILLSGWPVSIIFMSPVFSNKLCMSNFRWFCNTSRLRNPLIYTATLPKHFKAIQNRGQLLHAIRRLWKCAPEGETNGSKSVRHSVTHSNSCNHCIRW